MRYSHPQLVEHLASQYVLGTLHGGARRRFEHLLGQRADLRLAVHQWEQGLGGLGQVVAPQQPSPQVWQRIAQRTVAQAGATAAGASTASGWLGWLRPAAWGLSGIATGLIAAVAVFLWAPATFISTDQIAMRSGEKLPQSYVGLLTDAQGQGKVLVSSLRQGKTMTIKLIGPLAPPRPQQYYLLWAVPPQGPAFALGTLPAKGSATSQLPDTSEKLLSKVTQLIVTQETSANPAAPSAEVVLRGNCAKLW